MNNDHTVNSQVSITKGCEQDSITYLGDNTVQYTLYNVNEGYEQTSQQFKIKYDPEMADQYVVAWGEGSSLLNQPTLEHLTSV